MACNQAIVNSVDEDSDYYRIFNENKIGISVSNNDSDGVAEAIVQLYKDKDKREKYASNGNVFGQEYYSRRVNTREFIKVINSMIN